jgi:hypothetical protein
MPATTWPEAAAKAEYLIRLLADKVEAQDTVRQKLISSSLEELARLAEDSSGCL